jgi:hypothetical protein
MNAFEMDGYKIQVSVKIPHLYETVPTFSYQFLIFNKKGRLMNYPFSRIIAHNDKEFKLILNKSFDCYINYIKVKAYPKSKFVELVANNSS